MDRGMLTGAIYIDLSKAFDTIGHSVMLEKLPKFGITGLSQQWFCSYLFSRYQCVSYNGTLSATEPIFCGVPQGSILGPLLFLMHFNDAVNVLRNCKITMCADDTVLFFSHKVINEIKKILQKDFDHLCNWLEDNELIINTKKGKTEVMVFGTCQRLKRLDSPSLIIERNISTINNTATYQYLGLDLNCTLNMSNHLRKSLKKAMTRINLLKKIRPLLDSKSAGKIYNAMVLPVLTNCPYATCGTVSSSLESKIRSAENCAQKIIAKFLCCSVIL